jgi:hypothetical protein
MASDPIRVGGGSSNNDGGDNNNGNAASSRLQSEPERNRRPVAHQARHRPYERPRHYEHKRRTVATTEEETIDATTATLLGMIERQGVTLRCSHMTLLCTNCTVFGDGNFIQGTGNKICGQDNEVVGNNNSVMTPEQFVSMQALRDASSRSTTDNLASFIVSHILRDSYMEQLEARELEAFQLPGRRERVLRPDRDIKGFSELVAAPNLSSPSPLPSIPSLPSASTPLVSTAAPAATSTLPASAAPAAGICVVCKSEPSQILLVDCKHLCLCKACLKPTMQNLNTCPVCRSPITEIMAVHIP